MIRSIFLIFGDLSLDDSYEINSYKKKCVLQFPTKIDTDMEQRLEKSKRVFIDLQRPHLGSKED